MYGKDFDKLPFLIKKQILDYACLDSPSFLFTLRLVSQKFNELIEEVLQHRSLAIQKRRLNFGLLKKMPPIENHRSLKGLSTIVDEGEAFIDDSSPFKWYKSSDLLPLKDFLDRPSSQITQNVIFLHGSSGNGTSHLMKELGRQYGDFYHVMYIPGSVMGAVPNPVKLQQLFKEALSNTPTLLIIDDVDKMFFEYRAHLGPLTADAWYEQKEKLIDLMETVKNVTDLRIVLTSNELTLHRTEVHPYFFNLLHIPYKTQKERQYLLAHFTKDFSLDPSIQLDQLVKKLNGHVVKALYCVCRRASSLAILQNSPAVTNEHFNMGIRYVVFRQGIRPFVIRPRPNVASLQNPLTQKSVQTFSS